MHKVEENCSFDRGYVAVMQPYFMHLNRNCKQLVPFFGIVYVHLINVSFDMIVYTLTEIIHVDHAFNFLRLS